jgi:hypothetical protein
MKGGGQGDESIHGLAKLLFRSSVSTVAFGRRMKTTGKRSQPKPNARGKFLSFAHCTRTRTSRLAANKKSTVDTKTKFYCIRRFQEKGK